MDMQKLVATRAALDHANARARKLDAVERVTGVKYQSPPAATGIPRMERPTADLIASYERKIAACRRT